MTYASNARPSLLNMTHRCGAARGTVIVKKTADDPRRQKIVRSWHLP